MTEYLLNNVSTLPLQIKHDYPGYKLRAHQELKIPQKNIKLMKENKKIIIINYEKETILFPTKKTLSVIETSIEDPMHKDTIGSISIKKVEVKRFAELTDDDAKKDGIRLGLPFLKKALRDQYPDIKIDDLVSIYYFE